MTGGAVVNPPIQEKMKKQIEHHLGASLILETCTIYKVGMLFKVHAKIRSKTHMINTEDLLEKKEMIEKEISAKYEFFQLDFVWN